MHFDSPVITEMILTTKGFGANITTERPLVGVSPFVNEKIVRLGELKYNKSCVTTFTHDLHLILTCLLQNLQINSFLGRDDLVGVDEDDDVDFVALKLALRGCSRDW